MTAGHGLWALPFGMAFDDRWPRMLLGMASVRAPWPWPLVMAPGHGRPAWLLTCEWPWAIAFGNSLLAWALSMALVMPPGHGLWLWIWP